MAFLILRVRTTVLKDADLMMDYGMIDVHNVHICTYIIRESSSHLALAGWIPN